MYHKATLQLIAMRFYYTKPTGEMRLSNSELPSYFPSYSAHDCSARIHISLDSESASKRWERFKISVSIDFHRQSFLHLSDWNTTSCLQSNSSPVFPGISARGAWNGKTEETKMPYPEEFTLWYLWQCTRFQVFTLVFNVSWELLAIV